MKRKPLLEWGESDTAENQWNAYYNGFRVGFISTEISAPETIGLPEGKDFYCVFLNKPLRQFPESLEEGKEWLEELFYGFVDRAAWEATLGEYRYRDQRKYI